MGTSLSGLTPATTFDGLLKVGDNDPLTAELKAISTGDGTDTILSLSDSALQIGGATTIAGVDDDYNTIGFEIQRNSGQYIFRARNRGAIQMGSGIDWIELNSNSNGIRLKTSSVERARLTEIGLGIGELTPTSSLHVKGSGATSATTSLLVQNSAGTDMLKVQDDGKVLLSNSNVAVEGSSITRGSASITLGTSTVQTAFSSHSFNLFDGVGYTEAMRISGTDKSVGIGETTPTARLHVKGSGNDNTTTSLLVQNSDGDDMLSVDDDGAVTVAGNALISTRYGFSNDVHFRKSNLDNTSYAIAQNNSGDTFINMKSGRSINIQDGASSIGKIKTQGWSVNHNDNASASLHVKGSGNDATTTALLVQNSDGANLLKVDDSGTGVLVNDDQPGFIRLSASGEYATIGGGRVLRINSGGANPLMMGGSGSNGVVIGSISATTLAANTALAVKGQGATSATTALLVQNSAGASLLQIKDDGVVRVGPNGQSNTLYNGSTKYAIANTTFFGNTNASYFARLEHNIGFQIGNGTSAPTARLQVKGSGATSATTALLVENSAGALNLKVNDDGSVFSHGGGARNSLNTAFGELALNSITTGTSHTAFGQSALRYVTTGVSNTAVGWRAGHGTTVGSNNSFVGLMAGYTNSSGANNTGFGTRVLYNNGTGSDNTAIGYVADSAGFSGSIMLGRGATATADNQFVVGSTVTEAGTITTESVTSDATWEVVINGTTYKVLLKTV